MNFFAFTGTLLSANPLLSDGRLALPRQLCNYGVQAWGRNWAKNKQCVVSGERPLRSEKKAKLTLLLWGSLRDLWRTGKDYEERT